MNLTTVNVDFLIMFALHVLLYLIISAFLGTFSLYLAFGLVIGMGFGQMVRLFARPIKA